MRDKILQINPPYPAGITDALETYFDGLYHSDYDRLAEAVHPQAIYATADVTPLLYRAIDEYIQVVEKRESPASRQEIRHDVIDAIEFVGNNTAFTRVRCSIDSRDFTDFLTFVQIDVAWRIIAMVFQITKREIGEKSICPA